MTIPNQPAASGDVTQADVADMDAAIAIATHLSSDTLTLAALAEAFARHRIAHSTTPEREREAVAPKSWKIFETWFFRDINDEARLSLIRLLLGDAIAKECGPVHGIQRHALKQIRRRLALPPATQAGDGWKLVPVEATDEMVRAVPKLHALSRYEARLAWDAMLSAAPTQPKAEPSVAEGDRPFVKEPLDHKDIREAVRRLSMVAQSTRQIVLKQPPETHAQCFTGLLLACDEMMATLATPQPEASVEVREAIAEGVFKALYGPTADPFQNPEAWAFAEKAADIAASALKSGCAK